MFKTICLFAIIALAISQDVATTVTDAVNNAVGSTNVGSTTVDQAAQNAVDTVSGALANTNITEQPTLNSITVGWGSREVVVTPQAANPTNDDWFTSGETLNVEQVTGTAADGEWTLNWSVENGDDFAVWNNNGELQLVDFENGVANVVYNVGSNDALDAEIASGAEQIVDGVYNSGATTINTDDVASDINNLVNQVISGQNLQGFLAQNGQSTQSTVSSVVDTVVANPQQAVDAAQNAVSGTQ